MGQQVVDGEQGVAGVGSHGHVDQIAVFHGHHAPQLQGDGHPLVLADAAVIVGFQEGQLAVLVQRGGLQIQPGAVGMGADQAYTFRQRALAPAHGEQSLAIQGLEAAAFPHAGFESRGTQAFFNIRDGFPLRLAARDEIHIVLGQGTHGLAFFRGSVNFPGRTVFMGKFFHRSILCIVRV